MRVSFGFRQSGGIHASSLQAGGYVQEGRGRPAASSHMPPASMRRQIIAMEELLAETSRARRCRLLDGAGSFPLGRRLGLRSAGGVVCAAAHDHLGLARLPGDHCEGCEGLRAGRSVYKVPRGLPVWRNASRTRVDSPGARAAKYRGWANRQPA